MDILNDRFFEACKKEINMPATWKTKADIKKAIAELYLDSFEKVYYFIHQEGLMPDELSRFQYYRGINDVAAGMYVCLCGSVEYTKLWRQAAEACGGDI